MSIARWLISALLCVVANDVFVHAFSSGAGACTQGMGSPIGLHLRSAAGTIAGGGIGLMIGGQTLQPGTPVSLTAGMPYNVTVQAGTDGFFRGILLRVGPTGTVVSTSGAFTIPSAFANNFSPAVACPATVGSVTHTNNMDKQDLSVTIQLDTAATGYPLDVNVVVRNDMESIWYYDSYTIDVTAPMTSAPVSAAPVTAMPAAMGMATAAPTPAPTVAAPTSASALPSVNHVMTLALILLANLLIS